MSSGEKNMQWRLRDTILSMRSGRWVGGKRAFVRKKMCVFGSAMRASNINAWQFYSISDCRYRFGEGETVDLFHWPGLLYTCAKPRDNSWHRNTAKIKREDEQHFFDDNNYYSFLPKFEYLRKKWKLWYRINRSDEKYGFHWSRKLCHCYVESMLFLDTFFLLIFRIEKQKCIKINYEKQRLSEPIKPLINKHPDRSSRPTNIAHKSDFLFRRPIIHATCCGRHFFLFALATTDRTDIMHGAGFE